ncbi:MAG: GNAT family N-acetyltransferase [Dehalococcoidia bacterium]
MTHIHMDTSPDAMADAIQADLRAAWASYAAGPGASLLDNERISRLYTGLPVPIYNAVTHFQFPENAAPGVIAETLAYFREANVPCSWWLGPQTQPPDFDSLLQAHRPSRINSLPGMAMDLRMAIPTPKLQPGDTIEEVLDDDALLEYVRLDFLGFEIDPGQATAMAAINKACGYGPGAAWRHFTIRRAGRMIANTSLFTGAGVAGLYGVATHPDARRQGLATALVLHVLNVAQRAGYTISTLQASALGEPVYRKIGFQTYSDIRLYEWLLPYNT